MTTQEQFAFNDIDDVKKVLLEYGLDLAHDVLHQAENVLKKSIEERKTGKWNEDGTCSVCGTYSSLNLNKVKYCPECGAKMEGAEE